MSREFITKAHYPEESNLYSIHPRVSLLINLYEIVDGQGEAIWGGNDTHEAIKYLRNSTVNCRILVSGWESDDEDAHLVGQPIDITKLVYAVLAVSQ